jgi:phospholipase/carboxylesterase
MYLRHRVSYGTRETGKSDKRVNEKGSRIHMKLDHLGVSSIWQPAEAASPQRLKSGGVLKEKECLLIVLHGRGDSAEGFSWLQSELGLAGLNCLLLNAPDDYYGGFSWYDLPPHQLPGILRSRLLLDQVMEEVFRSGFPPERCFLFGFSQGCLMTLEWGGRFHSRLAGCIGVSGYCYDPKALLEEAIPEMKDADWLITHGTADDLLPVKTTRAQIEELIQGGFRIDYREYPKEHTVDFQSEIAEIRQWIQKRMSI